ncbi:hypothetical protein AB0G35_34320 [Streptomyces sp. NPDC021749]|uniref:hypothetical protein n=1 Tax=Streptomyces sp. NPDC021749 TaxID=3154905 RepID=UPI0033F6B9E7
MGDHPGLQEARRSGSVAAGQDTPGQPGAIGIALAAVLTAALAQGSWQWFSTSHSHTNEPQPTQSHHMRLQY